MKKLLGTLAGAWFLAAALAASAGSEAAPQTAERTETRGFASLLPPTLTAPPQLQRAGSKDLNNLSDFQVHAPLGGATFESMYDSTLDQVLNGTGRETFEAVKLIQALQKQAYTPSGNAKYPGGRLGQSLLQIARLIKSDVGLEVAFADVGGWDTHFNEMGAKPTQGQLANLLGEFGQALAASTRTSAIAWPT